eukprot:TRINITY_DN16539_c0_g3_i1.p1 TRINITY_DN16539_c0_g3~~TRINITY_DN16539_c0_g3_i1.p1  ORF type:complete len:342 (+),score=52.32 TRINITY_DN16539_c0_g3_i1:54-1079(+)
MAAKSRAKAKARTASKGARNVMKKAIVKVKAKKARATSKSAQKVMKKAKAKSQSKPSKVDLAAKLEQVAYGHSMINCNDVWKIQEKMKATGLPYAESKSILFMLKPMNARAMETEVLKKIKHGPSITKLRFHPYQDGDFDLKNFSASMKKYLPKVSEISFQHACLKNFELKDLDRVKTLLFIGVDFKDNKFDLHLPYLKELILECSVPAPKEFSKSLLQCPRIERFFTHKFWCVDMPPLYLPHCKNFTFRRGDCVSKLHMFLPRVQHVNLDANYDLSDIKFITQGRKEIKDFCLQEHEQESHFTVSAVNAFAGLRRGPDYLLSHTRVSHVTGLENDIDFFR